MKHTRALSLALLLAAGTFALPVACVDSTAPRAVPEAGADALLGLPIGIGVDVGRTVDTTVTTLRRVLPLTSDITRSATFGFDGGTLSIPEAGFTLTVPRGAFYTPTTITVTAIQGSTVAYEFAPHGLKPYKKLIFSQELGSTLGLGLLGSLYKGAYFESRAEIDEASGTAFVHEIIGTIFDPLAVRFPISHFSGYLVAVGYEE